VSLLAITSNGKIGLGLVALVFIAFALVSSFVLPRRNPDFPGRRLGAYLAVAVLLFVAMLAAVVVFAKEGEEEEGHEAQVTETAPGKTTATTGTETETGTGGASGDAAAGEAVFDSAGCGDCHTLEAAGSSGSVGPNLDESKPDAALVEERVRNGSGPMPAFEGRLSDTEIADVTAYVVASTSG
jgi:mono/diheme cytochrome c family protein